jgi:hypothetical protein
MITLKARLQISLNSEGMISGEGKRFNRMMVARVRSHYGLKTRYARLRARGMLTLVEIAKRLDISAARPKRGDVPVC